jgi:hypothetical protein
MCSKAQITRARATTSSGEKTKGMFAPRVFCPRMSKRNCFRGGFSTLPPRQTDSEMMATVCKHPRVRIVSRHEDAEFVECLECGEVFDSEEFRDMEIEETVETEEAESEY